MTTTRRLALVFVTAFLVVCATGRPASAQSGPRCAPRDLTSKDLLALDLESLLNVKVVTASKFSESQSDAPGVISVVSQDELRRFGGTTLREVLERVPGLASSTAYFTDRSMVAARGDQTKINGGHVLFLINGRPTREVLEGGLVSDLLESFPVNVLERIEVIKGPGSVLYGSNAFSAVVNLITLEGEANGFSLGGAPGTDGRATGVRRGHVHVRRPAASSAARSFISGRDWNTTYWFNNPIPDDPFAAGVPSVQDATIRDRSRGGFAGVTLQEPERDDVVHRVADGGVRARHGRRESLAAWIRGRRLRAQGGGPLEDEPERDLHAKPLRDRGVPVHRARLERDAVRVDQLRQPDVTRSGDLRRAAQPGERPARRTTASASR